ncbi:unnamed protein product, partial [Pelagomonas calceolata]
QKSARQCCVYCRYCSSCYVRGGRQGPRCSEPGACTRGGPVRVVAAPCTMSFWDEMNRVKSERTGDQIACGRCGYPQKWCTCEGDDDSGEDAPAQDEEAALECAPAQDEEAALECVPRKV